MSIKNNYLRCLCVAALLLIPYLAEANQLCFARAGTYYEQVYCELEVKGQAKTLPPFDQFKQNNEIVQASLLKNLAERNGIKLPPPKKLETKPKEPEIKLRPTEQLALPKTRPPVEPQQNKTLPEYNAPSVASSKIKPPSNCKMDASGIHCGTADYHLIGNKTNNHLAEGVLNDTNKMALPTYQKDQPVDVYLSSAYQQYIEKMCVIGLGGVTMTYAKFAYFYQDLQTKGVSFVQRFEIMYNFLKKDKATMWISEKVAMNSQLTIEDCDLLSAKYYICAKHGDNYIFELQ